ncbi:MAG: hypothetical protein ACO1RA_10165 [Planctomycetaceae bacterium]
MSEKPQEPSSDKAGKSLPPLDEALLVRWRAEAEPIISVHRGLTSGCVAQLARLAEEMGMSKEQVPLALRALEETSSSSESESAGKFRKRLSKDLASKARSIIGPNVEARILESAKRKYGLEAVDAMPILREILQSLGIQRITDDDVYAHLLDSIEATIGDTVYIRNVQRENLRAAAAQWGIKPDDVDELIEQKLESNRRQATNAQRRSVATILVAVTSIGLTLCILFVLWQRSRNKANEAGSGVASVSPDKTGTEIAASNSELSPPAFWDVDLTVEIARLRTDSPLVAESYASLCKADPAVRAEAYAKLVDATVSTETSGKIRQSLQVVLSRLFLFDTDESASYAISQRLLTKLPVSGGEAPAQKSLVDASFLAVRALEELLVTSLPQPAKQASLVDQVNGALEMSLTPAQFQQEESLNAAERQMLLYVARRWGENIALTSRTLPASAIEILDEVFAQASAAGMEPSEVKELRERFVLSVVLQGQLTLTGFRRQMESTLPTMDASRLGPLADAYERLPTSPEKNQLAKQLALRAKIAGTASDAEILATIRSLAGVEPASEGPSDRWQYLRDLSREPLRGGLALPGATPSEQMRACERVAKLHTLAFVLACAPAGETQFDNLVKSYFADPGSGKKPAVELSDDTGTTITAEKSRVQTPKEHKDLDELCNRLHNFGTQKPIVRSNFYRAISHIANLDPGLTPSQATEIARYLVSEKSDEELQSILEATRTMARRVELRLALLERWHESKLSPTQRITVLNNLAMKERAIGLPAGDASDAEIRYWLLITTAQLLAPSQTMDESGTKSGNSPEEIQLEIGEAILDRGISLSSAGLSGLDPQSSSISQILAATLLAWRSEGSSADGDLLRQVRLCRQLAHDDLGMTLLLQQLWIDQYRSVTGREIARPLVLPVEVLAKRDNWGKEPQSDLARFYATELTCLEGLLKLHGQTPGLAKIESITPQIAREETP